MIEALDLLGNTSLWAAVLRIATPLIFGVLGALLCERAGVLNLGMASTCHDKATRIVHLWARPIFTDSKVG